MDGLDGVGVVRTVLIDVPQAAWDYCEQDHDSYFIANVDVPEITEKAFDEGRVKMYRVYDFKTKNPVQMEIPYVLNHEAFVGETPTTDGYWWFYNECVYYEFGIGYVNFIYTVSDFDYEIDETFVPEAMQFRLVVMY